MIFALVQVYFFNMAVFRVCIFIKIIFSVYYLHVMHVVVFVRVPFLRPLPHTLVKIPESYRSTYCICISMFTFKSFVSVSLTCM